MSGWQYVILALLFLSVGSSSSYVALLESYQTPVEHSGRDEAIAADTYTPYSPFSINGNDDFISQGWPGSGSESDPYVIEGLNITSSATGIYARNTDVYFEVRNCLITSSTSSNSHGILFINVTHGTIRDSIVEMHKSGIHLDSCVDCVLTNNTITDNYDGIFDSFSENTFIELNRIIGSSHYGVYEYRSITTLIVDNLIENTVLGAIRVEFSNHTEIRDNELDNQGWDGIRLCAGGTNQFVEGNTIRNSGWNGICSENPHTIIRNNTISDTTWYGIRVIDTVNNTIEFNHVSYSSEHGIGVYASESIIINGNTITDCAWCGIEDWGWNSTITNNKIYSITEAGIRTLHTSDSSIVANLVQDTGTYGIESWATLDAYVADNVLMRTGGIVFQAESHGGHISGNLLNDTFWTGLLAKESMYCTFEYNRLDGVVEDGILIEESSDGAIVRYNTFNDTGWQGLSVFKSSDCIFLNNEVRNVKDNGVLVLRAPNTIVYGNSISDVVFGGIALELSDGSLIMRNDVSRAGGHGITVVNTEYIELRENTINDASAHGIDLRSCREATVYGNIVNRSQTYDISLQSSSNCLIFLNAFLKEDCSEAREVLSSGIEWNNATHGNYWAQYDGVDEDGDGIGNTPYEINADNIDLYPLVLLSFFDILSSPDHIEMSVTSMAVSPEVPQETDSVTVSIGVSQPDSVWKVILSYSTDASTTWTNTTATRTGDYWLAEIPPQSSGSVVQYRVFVCNIFGEWIVTSESSYTVAGQGLLSSINPVTISAGIIGLALIGVGYMIHRGRRMKRYARYEEYFD